MKNIHILLGTTGVGKSHQIREIATNLQSQNKPFISIQIHIDTEIPASNQLEINADISAVDLQNQIQTLIAQSRSLNIKFNLFNLSDTQRDEFYKVVLNSIVQSKFGGSLLIDEAVRASALDLITNLLEHSDQFDQIYLSYQFWSQVFEKDIDLNIKQKLLPKTDSIILFKIYDTADGDLGILENIFGITNVREIVPKENYKFVVVRV